MQWLLDYSEKYRAQLRQGPFFTSLSRADRPNDLQWIHQLVHQSREFTQSLCLRYSLCHDKRFQPIFAEHAVEEADHPDQLIDLDEKARIFGRNRTGQRAADVRNHEYLVFLLGQRDARSP